VFETDPAQMQCSQAFHALRLFVRWRGATRCFFHHWKDTKFTVLLQVNKNKKLRYRRESVRRFVSLNTFKSLEVTRNDCWVPISISFKQCLYPVPFLRYSVSKNGVTLKLGVGVIQGHWKQRRSIDLIRLSIGQPL